MRLGTSKPKPSSTSPPTSAIHSWCCSQPCLACHDCAVLSRVGPDAGDRLPAVPGVHLLNLQLLPCGTKRATPESWWRTFLYMPFVMATGIGISVRNAQAVIEAIIGKKSEFARTPKYKIEGKQDSFVTKKYRNKAGWMPYAEVLLRRLLLFHRALRHLQRNYATRSVLAALRVGVSLHASCPSANLLRASTFWRQRA